MVEIKYKKRKLSPNPRVAKLRETGYFYTAMNNAADLKFNIEKLSVDTDTVIADLAPIKVPAYLLWFLADTYLDAYKMLQKEDLIKSGNISKISPTLH